MTKSLILPFSLVIASTASAGIITGGGGVASINDTVLSTMGGSLDQPELGLEKIAVPALEFRRARSRLSVSDQTTVVYKGESVEVTKLSGGIIDTKGLRQIMPEAEENPPQ